MTRGSGRRDGDDWRRWQYGSGGGASVAPFASDLIHAWYADREIGLVSGNVAAWGDAVGGADFVQAVVPNQPPYMAANPATGNKPAIGPGNGVSHRLVTATNIDLSALTDITHAISIQYGGGTGIIYDTGTAAAFGAFTILSNGGTIGLRWLATAGAQQVFFAATPGNVYRIVYVLHVGAGTTYPLVYVNAVSAGTGGTSDRGFSAAIPHAMFARESPVTGWSTSTIVDNLIYGRALSAPEIIVVDSWLASRCT